MREKHLHEYLKAQNNVPTRLCKPISTVQLGAAVSVGAEESRRLAHGVEKRSLEAIRTLLIASTGLWVAYESY